MNNEVKGKKENRQASICYATIVYYIVLTVSVRMSTAVPISSPNSLNHPKSSQIALKRCTCFSLNMPAIATANSESKIYSCRRIVVRSWMQAS